MAVPAETPAPVARAVPAVMRAPDQLPPMVVRAGPVAPRGPRVAVRSAPAVLTAPLCLLMAPTAPRAAPAVTVAMALNWIPNLHAIWNEDLELCRQRGNQHKRGVPQTNADGTPKLLRNRKFASASGFGATGSDSSASCSDST